MKYGKYLIKKGKIDLLSSSESLDKKLLNEKFKEFGVDDIYELRDYILDDFEFCLNEIDYDKCYCGIFILKKIEKMEFRFGKVKVFNKNDYSKYEGNGCEAKLMCAKLPIKYQ